MTTKLVLASRSPRRKELLEHAGLNFEVRSAGIPETPERGESPVAYVRRLSRAKAEAVRSDEDEVVLGADTVVVLDDDILEKPNDEADAARMLGLLSGREHRVITGICLLQGESVVSDHVETRVRFLDLSAAEIAAYAASGEPMDKAGAYAIQGLGSKFVDQVQGCYFNVVGLPVSRVYRRLKEMGW